MKNLTVKKITITSREAYMLWSVICWFEKPIGTSQIKGTLANVFGAGSDFRKEMDKKYEKKIITRIVELGKFIEEEHPEWLEVKS